MKKASASIVAGLCLCLVFSLLFTPQVEAEATFQVLWRTPIIDNILFNADVGDVDGDGINDVAVIPVDAQPISTPATNNTLQIIKSDGTNLWTKSIQVDGNGVALKDVDLDGKSEVFVFGKIRDGNYGAILYAIDDNGTNLWQFNPTDDYWGYIAFVLFMDLDTDAESEIIAGDVGWERYMIYALDTDGSLLWKFRQSHYGADMAVKDVTGDGVEEIILFSFREIYVLDKQGNIIWQQAPHTGRYGASGTVGDVTGDGVNDIAVSVNAYNHSSFHNTLYVYRNDGTLLWQKNYPLNIDGLAGTPIVLDINNDGIKDVVVAANRTIYAYRNDGILLWTFGNQTFFNQPYVNPPIWHLDINGDGREEIVFAHGPRLLAGGYGPEYIGPEIYALSSDGSIISSFTLPNDGKWMTQGAWRHIRQVSRHYVFGDINNDGLNDLVIQQHIDGQHYVAIATLAPTPECSLTIYSSPTGVTFTVDGLSRTTPWSGTYSEGASVSLVMPETHDGYVFSHWLEDGDTSRIKTVTMNTNITLTVVYTRPPPPPPVGGKAIPINKPIIKPELQIPWIWLTTIILPLVATVVYVKFKKKKQ